MAALETANRPLSEWHRLKQAAEHGDLTAQERLERQRTSARQAQQRWRERHPDDNKRQQKAYRQSPKGKEHNRLKQRGAYWRKKGMEPPMVEVVDEAALAEQSRERRRQWQQAYRATPEGGERIREAHRRWYWRKKGMEPPPRD